VRRVIFITAVSIILAACGIMSQPFSVARLSELYIADFVSDAPLQCQPSDVDLTKVEAIQFFRQARQVDYKILHDHYNFAPCGIEGTLRYQQQSCDWKINAGATGQIRCADTVRYFACDDCEQLFVRKPSASL